MGNYGTDGYMQFPKSSPKVMDDDRRTRNLVFTSTLLLYVNFFSLIFFVMSVLTTKNRIFDFFNQSGLKMPVLTYNLLSMKSEEYMLICVVAAFLLIAKERWINKQATLIINILSLLAIWLSEFFYIWGISLPFVN